MKESMQLPFLNLSILNGNLPRNGVQILQEDFFRESPQIQLPTLTLTLHGERGHPYSFQCRVHEVPQTAIGRLLAHLQRDRRVAPNLPHLAGAARIKGLAFDLL
jgi:hypothetical protein